MKLQIKQLPILEPLLDGVAVATSDSYQSIVAKVQRETICPKKISNNILDQAAVSTIKVVKTGQLP